MTQSEDLRSRVLAQKGDRVIPSAVADAMKVDFGIAVTAYLCCTAFTGYCAIGLVFSDRFGRFDDGDGICTSNVLSMTMIKGYAVLETLNSWYVVITWANDHAWPRFPGPLH